MNKIKIYKIMLVILVVAIVIVVSLITIKNVKSNINEKDLKEAVAQIYSEGEPKSTTENASEELITSIDEIDMEIKGNRVVGIIKRTVTANIR